MRRGAAAFRRFVGCPGTAEVTSDNVPVVSSLIGSFAHPPVC